MNMRKLFFCGLITLGLLSCSKEKNTTKNNFLLNDTLKLNYGTIYTNYENNISLRFDSVITDSRCPQQIQAECYSSGDVVVQFTFSVSNNHNVFPLSMLGFIGTYKKDTTISGYRIKMLGLSPSPSTSQVIQTKDYVATALIQH
jgi:hypothetical protein